MQATKSISRRLLVSVLSVYFILTFIVTCIQVIAEYKTTKDYISNELRTLENTFSASLTRAIWEINTPQVISISEGLIAIPMIEGVMIKDENDNLLTQMGEVSEINNIENIDMNPSGFLIEGQDGLFGYEFDLIFEFSGRSTQVGKVSLFSSRDVVVSRIIISVYFMIGSAMTKTAFLIGLFLLAFRKHLTTPLGDLVDQIEQIDLEQLGDTQLNVSELEGSELSVIQNSFNNLLNKVSSYQDELKQTQKQLLKTNDMLDQQNLLLEQEVAKKTANLSQAMMDLQKQKHQLETQQNALKEEIETRRQTEQKLVSKTKELQSSVQNLSLAQGKLVESEKLAALGGLVAGITHDVNTPIGVGVTATSFLDDRLKDLEQKLSAKTLSSSDLLAFINEGKQSISLLNNNLNRASELIASFKQIAVDQASEAIRTINLKEYLNEIITSLKPKLKKANHTIDVSCPEDIVMKVPAGAISQIFTNFLINSVIHGFDGKENGHIAINIIEIGDNIDITYSDDGHGVTDDQLQKLFDPFFTTRREEGGSGLGTNIAFNLVKQTLEGEIQAFSQPGQGLSYHLTIPKEKKAQTDDSLF